MTANEKIKLTHLNRCAYVYVRQSTAARVQYNRESTDRQYKLTGRALRLGWSKPQIEIINEDLAHLGSQTSDRHSFAMMTTEVALGHVGLILSIEVSRVACYNADCYRLLDLYSVAYADTLIADEDGLYHLGFLNDRLFGPSAPALVPLPRSLLSLAVKFLLPDSLGHPNLHRHPPGLDQSNLCRRYLTLVLTDGSRSLIPAAWTDLDMNPAKAGQTPPSDDRQSTSFTLGSLSRLLRARKVVDSLLRKIDASEQVPLIPSKEERERATPTRPLARSGKTVPGTDHLGGSRPPHANHDHRHTVQVDQQGGLSKNSGGQP